MMAEAYFVFSVGNLKDVSGRRSGCRPDVALAERRLSGAMVPPHRAPPAPLPALRPQIWKAEYPTCFDKKNTPPDQLTCSSTLVDTLTYTQVGGHWVGGRGLHRWCGPGRPAGRSMRRARRGGGKLVPRRALQLAPPACHQPPAASPLHAPAKHLPCTWHAPALHLQVGGIIAGQLGIGFIADRIGRKWGSVLNAALMFVCELMPLCVPLHVGSGRQRCARPHGCL